MIKLLTLAYLIWSLVSYGPVGEHHVEWSFENVKATCKVSLEEESYSFDCRFSGLEVSDERANKVLKGLLDQVYDYEADRS